MNTSIWSYSKNIHNNNSINNNNNSSNDNDNDDDDDDTSLNTSLTEMDGKTLSHC